MTMKPEVAAEMVEPDFTAPSALFRALGDPSRLAILRHLELGPHRVADLVDHLGLAQSTVSKHLACLRDCGLVSSTPQGRASMFALAPRVPVDELLAAAELVLIATGAAAASCVSVTPTDSADDSAKNAATVGVN